MVVTVNWSPYQYECKECYTMLPHIIIIEIAYKPCKWNFVNSYLLFFVCFSFPFWTLQLGITFDFREYVFIKWWFMRCFWCLIYWSGLNFIKNIIFVWRKGFVFSSLNYVAIHKMNSKILTSKHHLLI